jgi:hypothetical protein
MCIPLQSNYRPLIPSNDKNIRVTAPLQPQEPQPISEQKPQEASSPAAKKPQESGFVVNEKVQAETLSALEQDVNGDFTDQISLFPEEVESNALESAETDTQIPESEQEISDSTETETEAETKSEEPENSDTVENGGAESGNTDSGESNPEQSSWGVQYEQIKESLLMGLQDDLHKPISQHPEQKYIDFGHAMQIMKISAEDLDAFLALGPDALSNPQKSAQLPASIQEALKKIKTTGSWPALNAITGLLDLNISQLENTPDSQAAKKELTDLKKTCAKRRSDAGIQSGNSAIQAGAQLAAKAQTLDDSDPVQKAQKEHLLKQAEQKRSQGLKALESEKKDILRFVKRYETQDKAVPSYYSGKVTTTALGLSRGYIDQAHTHPVKIQADGLPQIPPELGLAEENLALASEYDPDLQISARQGSHAPESIKKSYEFGGLLAEVGQFKRNLYTQALQSPKYTEQPVPTALAQAYQVETSKLGLITQDRIDCLQQYPEADFPGDKQTTLMALVGKQEGYLKEITDMHLQLREARTEMGSDLISLHSKQLELKKIELKADQQIEHLEQELKLFDQLGLKPQATEDEFGFYQIKAEELTKLKAERAHLSNFSRELDSTVAETEFQLGSLQTEQLRLQDSDKIAKTELSQYTSLADLAKMPEELLPSEIPERLLAQRDQNMGLVQTLAKDILADTERNPQQKQTALSALGKVVQYNAETSAIPMGSDGLIARFYNDESDKSVRLKSPEARRQDALADADLMVADYQELSQKYGFEPRLALDLVGATTSASKAIVLEQPDKALDFLKKAHQIGLDDPSGELKTPIQKKVYQTALDNQRKLFDRQNVHALARFKPETGLTRDTTPLKDLVAFRREVQAQATDPALKSQIEADFALTDQSRLKLAEGLRSKAAQLRSGAREMFNFEQEMRPAYTERADEAVSDIAQTAIAAFDSDYDNLEGRMVDIELYDVNSAAFTQYRQARGLEQIAQVIEANPEEYFDLVTALRLSEEPMREFIPAHYMSQSEQEAFDELPYQKQVELKEQWVKPMFLSLNEEIEARVKPETGWTEPIEAYVADKSGFTASAWRDGKDAFVEIYTISKDASIGVKGLLEMSEPELAETDLSASQTPIFTQKSTHELKQEQAEYKTFYSSTQKYVDLNNVAEDLATLIPIGRAVKLVGGALKFVIGAERVGRLAKAIQSSRWVVGLSEKALKVQEAVSSSRVAGLLSKGTQTFEALSKSMIPNATARTLALNVSKEYAFDKLAALGPEEFSKALDWLGAVKSTDTKLFELASGLTDVALERWDILPDELKDVISAFLSGASETFSSSLAPNASPEAHHESVSHSSPDKKVEQPSRQDGAFTVSQPHSKAGTVSIDALDSPAVRPANPQQPPISTQKTLIQAGQSGFSPQKWKFEQGDIVKDNKGESFQLRSQPDSKGQLKVRSLTPPYRERMVTTKDLVPQAIKAIRAKSDLSFFKPNNLFATPDLKHEFKLIGIQGDQLKFHDLMTGQISTMSKAEFRQKALEWSKELLPPDQQHFSVANKKQRYFVDEKAGVIVSEQVEIQKIPLRDLNTNDKVNGVMLSADFPDVDASRLWEGQVIKDKQGKVWSVDTIHQHDSQNIFLSHKSQTHISPIEFISSVEKGDLHSEKSSYQQQVAELSDADKFRSFIKARDALSQGNQDVHDPHFSYRDLNLVRRLEDHEIKLVPVSAVPVSEKFPFSKGTTESPAYVYEIHIQGTAGQQAHSIDLIIPEEIEGKKLDSQARDEIAQKLKQALQESPLEYIKAIKEVRVNPEAYTHEPGAKDTLASASKSSDTIDIYPTLLKTNQANITQTMLHEHAHLIAAEIYNDPYMLPDKTWEHAMAQDLEKGGHITAYAQTNRVEDFAETVAFYLESDGGLLDPALRESFEHRFKALDQIFAANADPQLRQLLGL